MSPAECLLDVTHVRVDLSESDVKPGGVEPAGQRPEPGSGSSSPVSHCTFCSVPSVTRSPAPRGRTLSLPSRRAGPSREPPVAPIGGPVNPDGRSVRLWANAPLGPGAVICSLMGLTFNKMWACFLGILEGGVLSSVYLWDLDHGFC